MSMTTTPRGRAAMAISALLLLSACLAVMGIASGARTLRRHVVVHVFNVNDYANVFVNCQQAVAILRAGDEATVDLGWLRPDDRVTLQARNGAGDASWGFTMKVNGQQVLRDVKGRVGSVPAGGARRPEQVARVLSATANGKTIGAIGCQEAVPALAGARLTDDARFTPTGQWLTVSTWLADRLRWLLVTAGVLGLIWLYFTGNSTKTIWVLPLLAGWFFLGQHRFGLMFVLYGVGGTLLVIYIGVSLLGWRLVRQRAPAVVIASPVQGGAPPEVAEVAEVPDLAETG